MQIPKPMKDPCEHCPKAHSCINSENYKCPLFQLTFVRSWNETASFLRRLLEKEGSECP